MRALTVTAAAVLLLVACGSDAKKEGQKKEVKTTVGQQPDAELTAKKQTGTSSEPKVSKPETTAADESSLVGPIVKRTDKVPQAIIDAGLKAMGGRDRVAAIKTLTAEAKLTSIISLTYHLTMEYPDKVLADFYDNTSTLKQSVIVNGDKAYTLVRGKVDEQTNPQLADTIRMLSWDPLNLMIQLASGSTKFKLTYLGETEVLDRKVDAVQIGTPGSEAITAFFDSGTHLLIATRYEISRGMVTMIDEKHQEFDGIQIGIDCTHVIVKTRSKVRFSNIKPNAKLPADVFDANRHQLIR